MRVHEGALPSAKLWLPVSDVHIYRTRDTLGNACYYSCACNLDKRFDLRVPQSRSDSVYRKLCDMNVSFANLLKLRMTCS